VDKSQYEDDRVEIGPTKLALDEWQVAGLTLPNLQRMRQYRLDRLMQHIIDRDYRALLLLDPLNIR